MNRIIESKSKDFPQGRLVFSNCGWRTHTIIDPLKFLNRHDLFLLPEIGDLSPSIALGALGNPGNSAYYGFLDLCSPKEGEVVVISGAAGF